MEMKELDSNNDKLDEKVKNLEEEFNKMMLEIPNLPLKDVPIGKDDTGNVVIETIGNIPNFDLNVLRGKITYVFENENSFLFLQSLITKRGSYMKAEYNRGNIEFDFQADIRFIEFHRIMKSKIFSFIKPKTTARFKVTFPLYLPF